MLDKLTSKAREIDWLRGLVRVWLLLSALGIALAIVGAIIFHFDNDLSIKFVPYEKEVKSSYQLFLAGTNPKGHTLHSSLLDKSFVRYECIYQFERFFETLSTAPAQRTAQIKNKLTLDIYEKILLNAISCHNQSSEKHLKEFFIGLILVPVLLGAAIVSAYLVIGAAIVFGKPSFSISVKALILILKTILVPLGWVKKGFAKEPINDK